MKRIAVLMTCFNRKNKTLRCLSALQESWEKAGRCLSVSIFLTDDGCTDGTAEAIRQQHFALPIQILPGTGSLYWNGGMINSWKAAIAKGDFDGYLWLNDDTFALPDFWEDLVAADEECLKVYGKHGIYVGSTKDQETGTFTYGGFNYVSQLSLLDQFIIPDNKTLQPCQAAHGNITYVSQEVVEKMGIFCDKYWHGGSDHDYTYRAHKAGFPVLVLPRFAAVCQNDHLGAQGKKSPYNRKNRFHNILLFNRRCFPWRVPFILVSESLKIAFPRLGFGLYRALRKHHSA